MGTAGYLITNIFRVYLIYRFYNIFFTKYKINKKCVFFVYLIYYVINSIVYIKNLCTGRYVSGKHCQFNGGYIHISGNIP